jgi:hypothetical protein
MKAHVPDRLIVAACCSWTGLLPGAEPNDQLHNIRKEPCRVTSMHEVLLSDFDNEGDVP